MLDDVAARTIHKRVIRGLADAAYSNVTIKTDVGTAEFNYIRENPELFPGVVVEQRFLRRTRSRTRRRSCTGRSRRSPRPSARTARYTGIAQGTRIGQSGLEERYDKYLRGRDGYTNVVVNAMGTRDDQRKTSVRNYVQGQRLRLTIDSNLEKAGDEALKQGIAHAAGNGASAGAYVAMDPTNGAVLAMGSQPSFDANVFARPFSQKIYDNLISDRTSAPLLDRATESGYPTGSVFKPVTALATLETGLISPTEKYNDTGLFEYGNQNTRTPRRRSTARSTCPTPSRSRRTRTSSGSGRSRRPRARRSSSGRASSASGGRPASTFRASGPAWCRTRPWRDRAHAKYSAARRRRT